jgi:hypothetical protein
MFEDFEFGGDTLCVLMIVAVLLVCGIAMFGGFTVQPTKFEKVMNQEEILNAIRGDYQWFVCGKEDVTNVGFKGTKHGKEVSGVVCSGFGNGYTVRYFVK